MFGGYIVGDESLEASRVVGLEHQVHSAHLEIDCWWPWVPSDLPLYMRIRMVKEGPPISATSD